jgi:hypothetical protein
LGGQILLLGRATCVADQDSGRTAHSGGWAGPGPGSIAMPASGASVSVVAALTATTSDGQHRSHVCRSTVGFHFRPPRHR